MEGRLTRLAAPRQRYAPVMSDSSVMLDILQDVAEETVKQAIAQHQERGGKKVTAARVRIIPGSLRLGKDRKCDAPAPDLVQEFVVRQDHPGDGDETSVLEAVPRLSDPHASSTHGVATATAQPSRGAGICSDAMAVHCGRSWTEPASERFVVGSTTATSHSSTPHPVYAAVPCSTKRLIGGALCSCLTERGLAHLYRSPAGGHFFQPSAGVSGCTPRCTSYASLPPASPYWVNEALPTGASSPDMGIQKFADDCLDTDRTKLKNLSSDIKSLAKDVFKLWTIRSRYEVGLIEGIGRIERDTGELAEQEVLGRVRTRFTVDRLLFFFRKLHARSRRG